VNEPPVGGCVSTGGRHEQPVSHRRRRGRRTLRPVRRRPPSPSRCRDSGLREAHVDVDRPHARRDVPQVDAGRVEPVGAGFRIRPRRLPRPPRAARARREHPGPHRSVRPLREMVPGGARSGTALRAGEDGCRHRRRLPRHVGCRRRGRRRGGGRRFRSRAIRPRPGGAGAARPLRPVTEWTDLARIGPWRPRSTCRQAGRGDRRRPVGTRERGAPARGRCQGPLGRAKGAPPLGKPTR